MIWNLVTFANEKFYDRQNYLEKYAESLGMGSYSYTHEWLKEQDFYEENKNILQDETGLGYFLWKVYIINDAINKMNDGDILFYTDVGDIFMPSLLQYVESIMEDDPCLLIKVILRTKIGHVEIVLFIWIAMRKIIGNHLNWRVV